MHWPLDSSHTSYEMATIQGKELANNIMFHEMPWLVALAGKTTSSGMEAIIENLAWTYILAIFADKDLAHEQQIQIYETMIEDLTRQKYERNNEARVLWEKVLNELKIAYRTLQEQKVIFDKYPIQKTKWALLELLHKFM